MHLLYVDESGVADVGVTDQPYYFLTAAVVAEAAWHRFDTRMRGVIDLCRRQVFNELLNVFPQKADVAKKWSRRVLGGVELELSALTREQWHEFQRALTVYLMDSFEIHGEPLYRATNVYVGVPRPARDLVLTQVFDALDELRPTILAVGVDKAAHCAKFSNAKTRPDPGPYCFSLLVERLDALLISMGAGQHGLLIADRGGKDAGQVTRMLRIFQRSSATLLLGKQITRVIDNLHFVDSVHSPGVQVADLCGYFIRHRQAGFAKTATWQARVMSLAPQIFVLP